MTAEIQKQLPPTVAEEKVFDLVNEAYGILYKSVLTRHIQEVMLAKKHMEVKSE